MIRCRGLSTTVYPINFLMVLSVDHITGATGKTVTVTLSKNGAAFGAAAGAVTEIASGWYSLAGNATDRNTLGELLIHATASGCDPVDIPCSVLSVDPFAANLGLANVAANVAQWNGANVSTPNVSGVPKVDVADWLGAVPNALQAGRVDGYVGAMATGVIAAATFAANALDGVWSTATRTLTSLSALAGQIASAMLDAVAASYNAAGSVGAKINLIGAVSDPWGIFIPAAYAAGTAGYILGHNLDQTISSLAGTNLTLNAPTLTLSPFPLVTNRDYKQALGNGLPFTVAGLGFSLLAGGVSIKLNVLDGPPSGSQTIVGAADTATTGHIDIAKTDTASWMAAGEGRKMFDIELIIVKGTDEVSVVKGKLPVEAGIGT